MKTICVCGLIVLTVASSGVIANPEKTSSPFTTSKFSYSPLDGCVPDAKTALKLADAILLPIYGEKEVEYNKPFMAVLRKGIWTVAGTGYHPGIEGGGMEIDISKADGRILRIYAGQ